MPENINSNGGPRNNTPDFEVTVSGETITQTDTKGMVYMSIEDHLDMIGVAQISLNIGGLKWDKFKVGDDVSIKVGHGGRKMFVGHITGLRHAWQKGNETLTIIAHDPLIKMAASRETKVYGEDPYTSPSIADDEIVTKVIGEAGCKTGTIDATNAKHKYVFQRNESHYNFCKRLAARNGYLLRANEGKIDFVKAQFSGTAVELTQERLMALDYTLDPVGVPTKVTTYGWDYNAKEMVEGSAGSGDILKIGSGKDAVADNGGIWKKESYISDILVTSQGGAKAMSVGELNRLARRFLRGRAVVQGDGTLHAGAKVNITGMFDKFNPETFVVSARHIVEPTRGFTTEIQYCGNTWPK